MNEKEQDLWSMSFAAVIRCGDNFQFALSVADAAVKAFQERNKPLNLKELPKLEPMDIG